VKPLRWGDRGWPAIQTLVVIALFAVGWSVANEFDVRVDVRRSGPVGVAVEGAYQPSYKRVGGRQLVMAYVGAASCGWSNQEVLPPAVETLKRRLAEYAEASGMSFMAVGVALDWVPERGVGHLSKFGLFDEISVGYNWGNGYALDLVWSDAAVPTATPQVLVYEREFIAPGDSSDTLLYAENERKRLAAATGLQQILEWAETGTVFPEIRSRPTQATGPRAGPEF